jgi:hypothetical protein
MTDTPSTEHLEDTMTIPDVVEGPPARPAPATWDDLADRRARRDALPETPPNLPLHRVIPLCSTAVGPINKDGYNEQQGFAFRSIEAIVARAGKVLAAYGVTTWPTVAERTVELIPVGSQGKSWRLVTLQVRYRIVGPMGDSLEVETTGEGFDPGDKAASKATTMARKAMLLDLLHIAAGDDADRAGAPAEEPPRKAAAKSAARRTEGQRRTTRPAAAARPPQGETAADPGSAAPGGPELPAQEVARVFGIPKGQVLKDARRIAEARGLPLPQRIEAIDAAMAEALTDEYQAALATEEPY